MKKVGLLINPIAGMGGRVGLKGTDGVDIIELAQERGAIPESSNKAVKALKQLLPLRDECLFLVAEGSMGEMAVREVGLPYKIIYKPGTDGTSVTDSIELMNQFKRMAIDLLLFAGGV